MTTYLISPSNGIIITMDNIYKHLQFILIILYIPIQPDLSFEVKRKKNIVRKIITDNINESFYNFYNVKRVRTARSIFANIATF